MFHKRGVIPASLLLALVLLGVIARILAGAPSSRATPPASTATSAVSLQAGPVRALDAVQGAFNAGDVSRLCRPGELIDAAVIRQQDAQSGGCRGEVEGLIGDEPAMRLTVRKLVVRPDLATATVMTARRTAVEVDLLRRGRGWLLSFSNGDDPMPALAAGTP